MSKAYTDRRQKGHDCQRLVVSSDVLQNKSFSAGSSTLANLPGEIILHIRDFLSFKDRCCFALTAKYFAAMMLEPLDNGNDSSVTKLQIRNTERKEIEVHPCPEKVFLNSHNPTPPTPPPKIVKHICGQYNELLRLLSRDWNSNKRKLCPSCHAFRPLVETYWRLKTDRDIEELCADTADSPTPRDLEYRISQLKSKYVSWCAGEATQCPDCGPDVWLRAGNSIDFPDPAILVM